MSIVDTLKKKVKEQKDKLWDLSADIVDYIYSETEEIQQKIFIAFLRDVDTGEIQLSDIDERLTMSEEQFKEFRDVSKTADRILHNLVNSNISEDDFYEKLWAKFNDEDLFTRSDDRTALLLYLWLNPCIPYYQLNEGCSMEDQEFEENIEQLSDVLRKAKFIIFKRIRQKTQRVSLLMELADSIDDYKKRVVFWSCVMSISGSKEAVRLIDQHKKAIEKDDHHALPE